MAKQFKVAYKEIFGEEFVQGAYKLQEHSFVFNSKLGKSVCTRCGLLSLRNAFTEWSVAKGCFSDLHPQYQTKRKLTGFN